MKKLIFISTILYLFYLTSCKKSNEKEPIVNESLVETTSFLKPTLEEFKRSCISSGEKEFFRTNRVKNYSSVYQEFLKSNQTRKTNEPEPEDIVARPRVRFFWGGRGCSNPLGACVIIPLINGEESNTDFIKLEDKAVILPKTDDNGLTYDGYFPVYSDLDIPIEVVNELGLSKNKIMAGIYQAYYDSTLNKYTGIVVDLN